MSSVFSLRSNEARYRVSVVNPQDNNVKSLTKIQSKGSKVIRGVWSKVIALVTALLFASLALLGGIAAAGPAQANNFVTDGFKDAFCAQGLFGYAPEWIGVGPTTASGIPASEQTAYERYGMAGMTWTTWLGPEKQEGLDDSGKFGGIGIVNFAGGKENNGGIDKWGDSVESSGDVAAAFPAFYNTTQTCVPIVEVGTSSVANFILVSATWVIHISNTIFQTAYETSSSVISGLEPVIEKIVKGLFSTLYLSFLPLITMLGALFLAWKGLVKKSSTEAAQAAMWMIGATIAGFLLMVNPMLLATTVNKVVGGVSEATISTITAESTKALGDNVNICKAVSEGDYKDALDPATGKQADGAVSAGQQQTRAIVRQMQCTMWYSFVYTPWAMGQFGDQPGMGATQAGADGFKVPSEIGAPLDGSRMTPVKLAGETFDKDWSILWLENKIITDDKDGEYNNLIAQQRTLLNITAAQLHTDNPNLAFRGDSPMNRVTMATLALLSAVGAAIMIVVISMSMIVLELGLMILTMMSVLFLLVGVHPGFGRRIALGWLETIAGLAMKRIVLSILLALMIVFYATILASSQTIPWMVSMIMVIAVSVGGLTYKDQLLTMFNKISFGGDGPMQAQPVPGSSFVKGALGGLVSGKVISNGMQNMGARRSQNKDDKRRAYEEIMSKRAEGGNGGAGNRPKGPAEMGGASAGGAGPRVGETAAGAAAGATAGAAGAAAGNATNGGGAGTRPNDADNRNADAQVAEAERLAKAEEEEARKSGGGAGARPSSAERADTERAANYVPTAKEVARQQRVMGRTNGGQPVSTEQATAAIIARRQADAEAHRKRIARVQKLKQTKKAVWTEPVGEFMTGSRGAVKMVKEAGREVGQDLSARTNKAAEWTGNRAPVRNTMKAVDGTRNAAHRAKEAASGYHAVLKEDSKTYGNTVRGVNAGKDATKKAASATTRKIKDVRTAQVQQKTQRKELDKEIADMVRAKRQAAKSVPRKYRR